MEANVVGLPLARYHELLDIEKKIKEGNKLTIKFVGIHNTIAYREFYTDNEINKLIAEELKCKDNELKEVKEQLLAVKSELENVITSCVELDYNRGQIYKNAIELRKSLDLGWWQFLKKGSNLRYYINSIIEKSIQKD